jgi:hypothetical protein
MEASLSETRKVFSRTGVAYQRNRSIISPPDFVNSASN